ncbi:hypothetical protein [Prevotella sp. 10(H)]|uniref:hypothetical protein n=1 Tax=Prevotella sp. 10(H) TaxID=1158294 RepID=UPI000AF17A00|nr:hypothetical protein [Prevotella sp. 10(H)]
MRQAITFISFLLCLSSCSSTYFFSTLSSKDKQMEKVDNGDFLLETDSLWIAYCFKGESAPVQITVFNKLDIPLYVDWQRSALILNGTAHSYAKNGLSFSGNSQAEIYSISSDQTYSYSDGSFAGQVESPKNVSFIPPKTMISYIPLRLAMNFENIDKKLYKKAQMSNNKYEAFIVNRIDYNEYNSPLQFGSYLTVYTHPDEPMVFQQDFFMSNLIKTNAVKPSQLPGNMADRGDFFYIEKPANNTIWQVALGTTLVVGAVAVEVAIDSDNRY